MPVDVIKIVILAFLIIISLGVLAYIKSQNSKNQAAVFEGFQVNDPMPRDFDNKTLSDEQLYGEIPQGATLSIFKKAELKGVTSNPDAIQIADGDKQGKGGGPQVQITNIPPQPVPADDIEAKLNAAADEDPVPFEYDTSVTEGFMTVEEANNAALKAKALADEARALGQDPKAYAKAKAVEAIKAQAVKMGYTGPMSKDELEAIAEAKALQVANAALAKAGVKVPPLPKYDTKTVKGAIMQKAQDFLIAQAKSRLKDAMVKQLMKSKVAKLAGKMILKAKAIVLKGVQKVTQKIAGMFAKKMGAKLGAKATEGIFKKLATRLVAKITEAVGKAQAKAAAFASNPITIAIGIMISVISAVAVVVGIALPIILKGDEGVCEPGWRKVSEVWPSFLDNIPAVGDVMGVIAPYLCFLDQCDGNEDENAGLCYDKCDKGYHGVVTMCVANSNPSNAKKPSMRPCDSGLRDDGTSCWLDTYPNGAGTMPSTNPCPQGMSDKAGSCWQWVDKHRGGCSDACGQNCTDWGFGRRTCVAKCCGHAYSDRVEEIKVWPHQRGSSCGNKVNIAGLCYEPCRPGYRHVPPFGVLCEPHGGPRIVKDMMSRQYCTDGDREMAHALTTIDQQCYTKCPADTPYRVPGIPTLCSAAKTVRAGKRGELTSTYDRGVGRPKLKLKMVTRTPPPPEPPGPTNSAAYADDLDTPCRVEFSDPKVLQDMCDFYYQAAVTNANTNADNSISFGYISKITKIIGSSEQSADIICDITNVVVNTDTGKTLSSTVAAGSDRRIYFAKIEKVCSFIVVGATNTNGTAPDVKSAPAGDAKVLNFVPVIQKCGNVPIGIKKCQNEKSINEMIDMYKKTLPPTVRIKSVDAVQDSGNDVCAVAWKEVNYNPSTNMESAPTVKVGKFKFLQDKSNDACAYKLQSYSPGNAGESIKPLNKPVVYESPLPREVTLQGCATTCKDPVMLKKLVNAFNTNGDNRILSVSKVVTPAPLRCDIEAEVFIMESGMKEKQTISFELTKDQASCLFNVKTVGENGSGTFIQPNTKALDTALNTKDFIVSSQTEAVKSAQTNLSAAASKITQAQGKANTAYESTFAQFGQIQTLGTCPKKCSDPDVLNAIISYYNEANYPKTRTGVTKKTMGRILKAGAASTNTCDILFEEKQEKYNDLYSDTPTVNVTQKTQRFNMKDMGGCQFVVDDKEAEAEAGAEADAAVAEEGFQGLPMSYRQERFEGLPMSNRKEGFQVTKLPSVVNTVTPSLNPPFTSAGCELDCVKAEVLTAMKQKYQSNNIEGFRNRKQRVGGSGFFSTLFASFNEAFQDAEGGDPTAPEVPMDQGVTDWNTAAEQPPAQQPVVVDTPPAPAKVVHTTNMKKVNRALKLGNDKCEYEVVYDSTDTDSNGNTTEVNDAVGYFTAVFTKDKAGCSYLPTQVTKSTTPIISTVPNTRTANIAFSF